MADTDACRSPASKSRKKGPPGIAVQSLSHSSNLKISSYQLQMRLDFSSGHTQAVRPRYVSVFHSSKTPADRVLLERCLCCEGGDCTCAYKTGQKKHCGSSTSSPSAISNQRSPGIALSPTLSDSTASMAIPHDIPDSDGTYPALTHVDLSNQPSETVPDTWPTPPDNGPHLVIPETPDWLGALDSVLGPVPDEQTQFSMSALNDPLLPMDSSYLADFLSDLPQTEQPNNADPIPTFDPALLDLTLFNFDNHEQSPRQS